MSSGTKQCYAIADARELMRELPRDVVCGKAAEASETAADGGCAGKEKQSCDVDAACDWCEMSSGTKQCYAIADARELMRELPRDVVCGKAAEASETAADGGCA